MVVLLLGISKTSIMAKVRQKFARAWLERKVYEFPYLIADFDAAVEYNGKYRLLKECTAVYEYVTE